MVLFCLSQAGDIYRVKDIDDVTIIGIHEKFWLTPEGDIPDDPGVRLIAKKRMVVIHENLNVVRGGYTQPEDQEAIVKLDQLLKIAQDIDLEKIKVSDQLYNSKRILKVLSKEEGEWLQ